MEKRLMNIGELSEYLSTTKGSLYTMVFEGKIPDECIVRMGRALRFDKANVDIWINSMSAVHGSAKKRESSAQ